MMIDKDRGLTAERLRELLSYDPDSGVFVWVKKSGRGVRVGAIAGSRHRAYVRIGVDGVEYRAHRLAWLWFYGTWPREHIDHIDGNDKNNAIANLRDVSRSVNMQNQRRAKRTNPTGYLGVRAQLSRFAARIRVGDKEMTVGTFDTAAEAYQAYLAAKRRLHAGCTL